MTKAEAIDRAMVLARKCEDYTLTRQQRLQKFEASQSPEDWTSVLAAGERLIEVRRELRDHLALSIQQDQPKRSRSW